MLDYRLLIIFVVLNIVNVVTQTVKSIATIKCGKAMASIVNALAYGLYTVVVVYTVCELPLWLKVAVVALCNLVGVFVVKWAEEKVRKDKLWKIEATVDKEALIDTKSMLTNKHIPHNYIEAGPWVIFNCYCSTSEESKIAKDILECANAKYFVTESKVL